MCYSIMVETDLRRLERDFGAIVDREAFLAVLKMRDKDRKSLKVARGLEPYFAEPKTAVELECKQLIDDFANAEKDRFAAKAAEQRAKIAELSDKLGKRWSKTNQEKLETAKRVLAKAEYDLSRLNGPIIPTDSAIFQYMYAPLIVFEAGKKIIRPFRYQVRPSWAQNEMERHVNMFNARTDMLEERKTWSGLYMRRHGVVIVRSFYEWVEHPSTGKQQIINFFPEAGKDMWVPALHEEWHGKDETIWSFAILTRDPPAEVASMGHDRCPVFPKWEYMDQWLDPARHSKEHYRKMFDDLEPVRYDFVWAA